MNSTPAVEDRNSRLEDTVVMTYTSPAETTPKVLNFTTGGALGRCQAKKSARPTSSLERACRLLPSRSVSFSCGTVLTYFSGSYETTTIPHEGAGAMTVLFVIATI